MDKSSFSETDIRTKYITPAIKNAGWDIKHQLREEFHFTDGRIIVRGQTVKRGKSKKVDYLLLYKPNLPLAIVEAKGNKYSIGAGMQQALDYSDAILKANQLDIPFIFSSNGDGFIFHDKTAGEGEEVERRLRLDEFPSPDELYRKYLVYKGITPDQEEAVTQEYYQTPTSKSPRYYQRIAVNRVVDAIIQGKNRVLLVMATGTGKTFTAFQIMWRLWKAKEKKRILFLADRNILVDDPLKRDLSPFKDRMIKIDRSRFDISKYTAYEVFLGIYQSMTGTEKEQKIFKQFSPDFFDLIVIDEAHRGSAREDSAWREILEYFSSATQVGMTATPKETKQISNIDYFGDPIYTYSLKQGIDDGFLAPYKVIRYTLDKDVEYRPEAGKTDIYGDEIPDREYNVKNFDKDIVIDERTKLVARKVTEFLKEYDRYAKTIIFCVDIDHAERMRRALINENSDMIAENRKYVMRITGDNDEGKAQLENFMDPEKKYPVIVTTSKLLTTGVDTKPTKLIVLDTNINSMIEFKQIIGRGTRVESEVDKYYFNVLDFRQATKLFADPDFDGEPVKIYEPKEGDPAIPPEAGIEDEDRYDSEQRQSGLRDGDEVIFDPKGVLDDPDVIKKKKYYIDGVDVSVINETVQFIDENGKLITESVKSYSKKKIISTYKTLNNFITKWSTSEKKSAIIEELQNHGVFFEELEREVGKDLDPFDLILHVAFDQPPLTRKERANNVKKRNYFGKYGDQAREILEALLEKYSGEGLLALGNLEVLKVKPLNDMGTPLEIVSYFGGKQQFEEAVQKMEQIIYMTA